MCFLCEYTVKCNLFLWSNQSLLQSSVSRDPSQITLIWGSDDQQTFMIIISVENTFIFSWKLMHLIFRILWRIECSRKTTFVWNWLLIDLMRPWWTQTLEWLRFVSDAFWDCLMCEQQVCFWSVSVVTDVSGGALCYHVVLSCVFERVRLPTETLWAVCADLCASVRLPDAARRKISGTFHRGGKRTNKAYWLFFLV